MNDFTALPWTGFFMSEEVWAKGWPLLWVTAAKGT
jgi:hypothetical protein